MQITRRLLLGKKKSQLLQIEPSQQKPKILIRKNENKILIVGTVSNVEKKVKHDLEKVDKAFRKFGETKICLIESDSSDNTLKVLNNLRLDKSNFDFISLGRIGDTLPSRIERIRKCRNLYIDFIRKNFAQEKWDYVVVADLDAMNSRITSRKIQHALNGSNAWDACFATQNFGYYDLYALRAKNWVEEDSLDLLARLKIENPVATRGRNSFFHFISSYEQYDQLRVKAIYSKMKILKGDFCPVDSAFGGLGIYKTEIFLKYDYQRLESTPEYKCEHLDLHMKLKKDNYRLVIDPVMTNSYFNVYNLNKIWLVRFMREFKKFLMFKDGSKIRFYLF